MERTVVALYDNLDTAQTAVQELLNNGFSRNDISVVRTNQQGDYTSGNVNDPDADAGRASGAAAGAGIGAVLGGLAGLLVGLGALAIPGIGPIIAAGPLATTLAGAGLGAATGGLVGVLADVGIPESEAGYYAEGVRRGGTLVTVRAGEEMVARATEIMNRYTPVDINYRAAEWQSSGWTGFDANAGPYSTSTGAPHTQQYTGSGAETGASDYRAQTGLTGENSGGTYEGTGSAGYTGPGTVYPGGASATGGADRAAGNAPVDAPQQSEWDDRDSVMSSGHGEMSASQGLSGQGGGTYERMQETDSTVHPRSSEGDYQARRDFLGGDEALGEGDRSSASRMIETGQGSYGSQGQDFERSETPSSEGNAMEGQLGGHQGALAGGETFTPDTGGTSMGTTGVTFRSARRFEDFDRDFRSDWEHSYRSTGYGYERYQPAYQYGYSAGSEPRYRGRQWDDVEADVRRDWEMRHPNDAWEDFKDAVRHAWQRVRTEVRDATD